MKTFIAQLCPPLLKGVLKGLFGSVSWHGDYPTWDSASRICRGYDAPEIARNVLEKTLAVTGGRAAFERDGVLFSEMEYNWPALACLLSVGTAKHGRLEVMDFGGSLGSFFLQHRRFLSDVQLFQWHVVEQPHFVEIAKTHLHEQGLNFHDSVADCLSAGKPTFAFLSSVLQYLQDPWSVIAEITSGPFTHLLVDRTPFTDRKLDRITVQKVSQKICKSRYPCRFFSTDHFLERISKNWKLLAEWDDTIDPCNLGGCGFRGMLFERRDV